VTTLIFTLTAAAAAAAAAEFMKQKNHGGMKEGRRMDMIIITTVYYYFFVFFVSFHEYPHTHTLSLSLITSSPFSSSCLLLLYIGVQAAEKPLGRRIRACWY
jgi:hypothetical protein